MTKDDQDELGGMPTKAILVTYLKCVVCHKEISGVFLYCSPKCRLSDLKRLEVDK